MDDIIIATYQKSKSIKKTAKIDPVLKYRI